MPATPSVRSLVAHSLPASVCSAHPSASGAASALRVPSACSVQVRPPESLGSFPVKRRLVNKVSRRIKNFFGTFRCPLMF